MQEGSSSGPAHSLEEKVDILTAQFSQLVQLLTPYETTQPSAEAVEEVDDFLSHHEEEEIKSPIDGKVHLPKFALPQMFDGTMKDTKFFISSIILYIKGHEPEFHTVESQIMFTLSYMQGGKAQSWRNEAINQIAAGKKVFKSFQNFLEKLEAQFGDPNPKATAVRKLKTMQQGSLTMDEFILQFKAEASQTDLGEGMLIKYLKAGLHQSLFKLIY